MERQKYDREMVKTMEIRVKRRPNDLEVHQIKKLLVKMT